MGWERDWCRVHFDGKLFKGMGSIAGEIGHMIVDINGPPCLCGNRGCLECIVLEDLKSNDTIAAADHLLVELSILSMLLRLTE